jgi:hypothetical protein
MPATFNFTKFVPNKLKKLSTLCYRSLIHVGIVDVDGQVPCQPSNKPRKDVANQPTPPMGASLKGVGRGRASRVLNDYADRPRKKLLANSTILFKFLCPLNFYRS